MSVSRQFIKYVSQNILGMIGISAYILADTVFISRAEGANGITALNLVLPVYSLIFAIGAMIGVGSATRFKIMKARGEKKADSYFSNALLWAFFIGGIFLMLGIFAPDKIVKLLGGDAEIIAVGTDYTHAFMLFSPFFMWNHIMNAFVRNDDDPGLAMLATLSSSLFNIVLDYILMFPCKLGMTGAALATGCSPIVGILICSLHFLKKENNQIKFIWKLPSVKLLAESCQLGVSAFVGEISSGVTTMVFNMLILRLAGNIGVAAYGVVANTALVAVAVFNGVSQGAQPLISEYYGAGKKEAVQKLLRMSVLTAFGAAVVLLGVVWGVTDTIVEIFNSEHSVEMAAYAKQGLRLYFIGFLFAGYNIVGTGYFSATEKAKSAFLSSISRGFIMIILSAVLLAVIFGMTGVWLAFPTAEAITSLLVTWCLRRVAKRAYHQ